MSDDLDIEIELDRGDTESVSQEFDRNIPAHKIEIKPWKNATKKEEFAKARRNSQEILTKTQTIDDL